MQALQPGTEPSLMASLADSTSPRIADIRLMEPMPARATFNHAAWDFSLAPEGHRVLAELGGGRCGLWSRSRVDILPWFPEIADALQQAGATHAVVDAVLCVLGATGRNDAGLLHERCLQLTVAQGQPRALLIVRDLLFLGDQDLRPRSWSQRRHALGTQPWARGPHGLRLMRTVSAEGGWLMRQAQALQVRAVHAYRRDAPYQPGRSADWLTIACEETSTDQHDG